MTAGLWKTVVAAIREIDGRPQWLDELAALSCGEVGHLPELGKEQAGSIARPCCTEHVLKRDYLEFLDVQIRLEPRGPEWTKVLRRRREGLQPFLGRKYLMVSLYRMPESATLYIVPQTKRLFLHECY